jgi:hypothetical protein
MYNIIPSATLIKTGYQYNSITRYVIPANAAASIGAVAYPSLALAVNAAKYGDTIELLGNNTETLTVSKVITIKLNGYTVEGWRRSRICQKHDGNATSLLHFARSLNIVSVAVESEIGEAVSPEDAGVIAELST